MGVMKNLINYLNIEGLRSEYTGRGLVRKALEKMGNRGKPILQLLDRLSFEVAIRIPPYNSISPQEMRLMYKAFMDHKEERDGCKNFSDVFDGYPYFGLDFRRQPTRILNLAVYECQGYGHEYDSETVKKAEKVLRDAEIMIVRHPEMFGQSSLMEKVFAHLVYGLPEEECGLVRRNPI